MICEKCNSREERDSKFCSACGAQMGAKCKRCNAFLEKEAQFCGRCGESTDDEKRKNRLNFSGTEDAWDILDKVHDTKDLFALGKREKFKVVKGLIVAVICVVLFTRAETYFDTPGNPRFGEFVKEIFLGQDQRAETIKNSYIDAYPDKTVGAAFADFFDHSNWRAFSTGSNEDIVEFTGSYKTAITGENMEVLIQFTLWDSGGFEATYFELNGVQQENITTNLFFQIIFESY